MIFNSLRIYNYLLAMILYSLSFNNMNISKLILSHLLHYSSHFSIYLSLSYFSSLQLNCFLCILNLQPIWTLINNIAIFIFQNLSIRNTYILTLFSYTSHISFDKPIILWYLYFFTTLTYNCSILILYSECLCCCNFLCC